MADTLKPLKLSVNIRADQIEQLEEVTHHLTQKTRKLEPGRSMHRVSRHDLFGALLAEVAQDSKLLDRVAKRIVKRDTP